MRLGELRTRATVTVEEAAAALGVSRGIGYAECRRYLATNGANGIPCLRLGSRLVVPVPKLLGLIGDTQEETEGT